MMNRMKAEDNRRSCKTAMGEGTVSDIAASGAEFSAGDKLAAVLGCAGRSLFVPGQWLCTFLVICLMLCGAAFPAWAARRAGAAGSPYGAGSLSASTAYERIYDQAGLFTEQECEELSGQLSGLRGTTGMDAAVVTTDENDGSAQEYADWFYMDNGLGVGTDASGVLLLIDMDNRELYVSTSGDMIRYLTDERIESILDDVYEYAAYGDYAGAAEAFIADVESVYRNGVERNQYNYDSETGRISRYRRISLLEFLTAFALAAVCGGFAVLYVVRSYRMEDTKGTTAANFRLSYRKDSAFRLGSGISDILLNTYVTHAVIRAAGNSRGGRPGGGHMGGGSRHSGRSTTHRSGGRSFGGRGRRF